MLLRFLSVLLFLIFLSGCSSQNYGFGFGSGDCEKFYRDCTSKCNNSKMSPSECRASCLKSRDLCYAMKIKGCMQDCDNQYGKGTQRAERCKSNCSSSVRE